MRTLLQQGRRAQPEPVGQGIEPRGVGGREAGYPGTAIPVGPPHLMRTLTGYFDQIAQKILIGLV